MNQTFQTISCPNLQGIFRFNLFSIKVRIPLVQGTKKPKKQDSRQTGAQNDLQDVQFSANVFGDLSPCQLLLSAKEMEIKRQRGGEPNSCLLLSGSHILAKWPDHRYNQKKANCSEKFVFVVAASSSSSPYSFFSLLFLPLFLEGVAISGALVCV